MSEAVEFDLRAAELYGPNDPRLRAAIEALEARQRAEREAHAARIAAEPKVEPRTALRTAVQKHADLTHRLAELTKAMPAADAAVMQARRAVEQATQAVIEVKANAASYASARALGTAGTAPAPLRNVRLKLSDCEDALEIAKAAARDFAEAHKETEQSLGVARLTVHDAIGAVVRSDPATQKLIAACERAHRQYVELRGALELVAWHFPQAQRLSLLAERNDNALLSERRAQWEAALAALQTNAEAVLPV
jgi:hypothetical protein